MPGQNKAKSNPHCPVPGCRTDQPHRNDLAVRELIASLESPDKLLLLVIHAITEIRDSVVRDVQERQIYAWCSRVRQPDELYYRTLYLMFCAPDAHVPHILSGCVPNSISLQYKEVNRVIFGDRGTLLTKRQGPTGGEFTVMENIHSAAHISFPALRMCEVVSQSGQTPSRITAYIKHLDGLYERLNYMCGMFANGKTKEDVKLGLINLHRS
jgi:hypothetical protein